MRLFYPVVFALTVYCAYTVTAWVSMGRQRFLTLQDRMELDPKINTDYKDFAEKAVLIAAISGCSCDEHEIGRIVDVAKSLPVRLEFVIPTKETSHLRELTGKFPGQRFRFDTPGSSIASLNICFAPRIYAFSHGRLVFIQKDPGQPIADSLREGATYANSLQ